MGIEINKIHCMDCLEGMKQIEDNSIDMILCDLPYGTTAVACKQLNRNFIGFEISSEYCEIANKRLKQSNLNKFVNCDK